MIELGKYRHYKGGLYLPIGVAERHTHNGDHDVVYVSLTHGKLVTRPLRRDSRAEESWLDIGLWPDGKQRERFVPDEPELAALFKAL
jgi:hypothetical protein